MTKEFLDSQLLKSAWIRNSARDFSFGKTPSTKPIETDEFGTKYLCGEMPVNLPGNVAASLRFERRILKDTRNQLFFSYTSPVDPTDVAKFFFRAENPRTFVLAHRHVDRKYRRKGIGSSLLKISEEWFHSLARVSGEPVTIIISIAQPAVMRWALSNGYDVEKADREMLDSILNESEKFVLEDTTSTLPGEEYVFHESSVKAVRLEFKKVLTSDT
ncbi:hypothetical protein A3B35_00105 [Candidatus Kaiserbacteria bacterium RIFCSPLOWO2_01_FULL_54_24]|uniref:N-acetyltransferase domain-containing protein n=1 Tax=Candidatus Kaiserbacteria bacterium RIFCSPLOWO2_01_FULL_54_24 TaxID=1798515 RepID=A0A1F6ETV3_9BACT|nr:MAG: hypothetical protein A3B35_00105 [Candidatus Kaiserbacteria bacterium RIFCSPLOWO2_01_FULL_54_24]